MLQYVTFCCVWITLFHAIALQYHILPYRFKNVSYGVMLPCIASWYCIYTYRHYISLYSAMIHCTTMHYILLHYPIFLHNIAVFYNIFYYIV